MRKRMCLALIATVAFGTSNRLRAADTLPVLTAAVHNYAAVPGDVLTDAEAEAARIFRHAGVRLQWVGPFASAAQVRVQILSRPMTVRTGTRPDVLGLATVDCGMVWVLYDRVVDTSESVSVPTSRVLGFVMAHEIGHVLLAGRGHSHVGLMKPGLEPRVLRTGLIGFTPEQRRDIRASGLLSQ
jgi:hypothetical protein